MDEKKRTFNANPYTNASLVSKFFLCWISPLIALGYKKPLQEQDLYEPRYAEDSENLTEQLKLEWKKECLKKTPSLMKAIIRLMYRKFLLASIFVWFVETSLLIQPLIISRIIKYFNGEITLQWAILYSIALSFAIFIKFLCSHRYFFMVDLYGLQMRIAVSGLIYEKTLKINSKIVHKSNLKNKNLNTIQLLSNDASKIHNGAYFLPYLVFGPYQAIGIVFILTRLVDYSILSGLLLFVIVLPIQSLLGKLLNYLKIKFSRITDERINLVSEVLNGIKIIKMNCWETPFKTLIERIRRKELNYQAAIYSISGLNSFIDLDFSNVMIFVSVTVFIRFTNAPLIPAYVVYIMSYANRMCAALGFFFMYALTELISAQVGIKRIQSYLLLDEIEHKVNAKKFVSEKAFVRVENLASKWSTDDDTSGFSLKNISFDVNEGELMAITGPVGSGKTSLLLSLLGEVPHRDGNVYLNGSVFYVSQESWLFTASIRQNILFGKEYNEKKFKEVVRVCQLNEDLKQFTSGELTLIGEKGINLSGGQRARISLARALYADPDIYLLDDPLSAVDANVAKLLFDKCINGYLKHKIRILVTHQVHYLNETKKVLNLINGEISDGSDTLKTQQTHNLTVENQSSETDKLMKSNMSLAQAECKSESKEEAQYDENYDEKHTIGSIKWKIYKFFFKSKFVFFCQVFILMVFVAAQGCQLMSGYFLSNWANQEEINQSGARNKSFENQIDNSNITALPLKAHVDVYPLRQKSYQFYLMLFVIALILAATKSILFHVMCLHNSKSFHNSMLSNVMITKMRFFDLNPLGRIVNRFSKDISNLDEQLPFTLYDFLQCTMICSGAIVMACFINFSIIFLLIPVLAAFIYYRRRFIKSSRELKRLEGISRSPIFVHANNTIIGITTIRSSNKQDILQKEFYTHLNGFTQTYFALCSINRWFGLRLDIVLLAYTLILVYSCIILKDFMGINSGFIGLLLIQNFQLSALFQWTVRQSAEVENLMTSVERIIEYSTLEAEETCEKLKKPEIGWPKQGTIEFRDVSYAYDKQLPFVLKNLNMCIKSGEKVGIIGRTGAGKSSFFQCLLRMGEQTGTILIDGVDIKELSLRDVRSRIALIPQEPTLFIGSVRSNIDPFNDNSDLDIWRALENVNLKEYVESLKGGLEARIDKGGSNLSVGQKQLFCLARAILRNAKILIVDEATANVDQDTDFIVQKAIRDLFRDQTVVTIAHRLHSVIDNDRIMCLSNGNLVDFDSPKKLLKSETSVLYELVSKLSEKEARNLYEMADIN